MKRRLTRDEQREQIPGRGLTDWQYAIIGNGGALLCILALLFVVGYFVTGGYPD